MSDTTRTFSEILLSIEQANPRGWVYLPVESHWRPDSVSAVLESEEVPPEMEDEPDAGVPEFAKRNGLAEVISVADLQDVVRNLREQKANASIEDQIAAFEFYYRNDAFIVL
jgi:hypothetical protein